jgi:hypothetical protein
MADDTTAEVIAISTGIVGALRAAGALRTEEAPTSTPPPLPLAPTPPTPAVGDAVRLYPLSRVTKVIETDPSARTRFVLWYESAKYELDFPPNDALYIPDLDRLVTVSLTTTQAVHVYANVEITQVSPYDEYRGTLEHLEVYGNVLR